MRPIDADALRDKLQREIDKVNPPFDDVLGSIRCGVRLARNMLEDEPTIDAEPHWIPCSERLPEVRQWVLCQCRAGIMDVLRLTADGNWSESYPYTEYMSGFVVACMPLPKPYEEEDDADE